MSRPIIALDADGVMLDYSSAYGLTWAHAFGAHPAERDASVSLVNAHDALRHAMRPRPVWLTVMFEATSPNAA